MSKVCGHLIDTIVQRDCIEGLRALPRASVDLIVADPPYNLNKDFGEWKEAAHKQEWLAWSKRWLNECSRVLRPGGSIFVYGIHHHLCWIQCHLYNLGLHYRRQIIWYYENGFAGYTKSLAAQYEPILWFSNGPRYTYHIIREPYKSVARLKHRIIKRGKIWVPHSDGRLAGDVWQFPVLAGRRFREEKVKHPTQKPLSISTRIVQHFSNLGDLVLVPFAGSGSECVAAKASGRHYLGFEINPEYIAIGQSRLSETVFRPPDEDLLTTKCQPEVGACSDSVLVL